MRFGLHGSNICATAATVPACTERGPALPSVGTAPPRTLNQRAQLAPWTVADAGVQLGAAAAAVVVRRQLPSTAHLLASLPPG